MTTTRHGRLLAIVVLTPLLLSTSVEAQVDQGAIAQQLLSEDVGVRSRALERARAIGPKNTGPELRAALITVLEREGRLHEQRYEAGRLGPVLEPLQDPEFLARVSRVVAELRDPSAIPALTGALGSGSAVAHALSEFGEQAAQAVLAVVTSPERWYVLVNDGLITLRFMVEGAKLRPLTASTLEQIRRAAEYRLTVPGRPIGTGTTLRWAIDLAVVLKDADLRRIVESLASDPKEVIARGVTDPQLIERTQRRAADRLAGIPPQPRR